MLNPMDIIHEQVADPARLIRRQQTTAGYFGAEFPWEILQAAGFAPVRLCGFPGEDLANETSSSLTVRLLEAHRHEPLGLELLCLPENHPDFELLKNESGLARHAVELPDPGISLKDTLAMFRKLREELTRLGTPCDDDALTTALVRSNLARYRYSELEEKVFSAKSFLQYSDLLAVSLLGQWTDREDWTDLVNELVANPLENVLLGLPVRLFLGGGEMIAPEIPDALERLDINVCGDAHGATGGHWTGGIDPDGNPLENLAAFYHAKKRQTLSDENGSAVLIQRVIESKADGVLWIVDPGNAQELQDAETFETALKKENIPVLLLKHSPWTEPDESLYDRLEEFSETL